jgi:hypothetical protein
MLCGLPPGFAYHAASVSTPRRFVASVFLVAVFASACTSGGDGDTTPTPETPTSLPPTGPVRFQLGEYRYEFGGVVASLSFDGSSATLEVKNASGSALDPPSLYVIDATGVRHDGTVDAGVEIPDGDSATFEVSFPEEVKPKAIGLVILLFGDSNYGAFAPVPVA